MPYMPAAHATASVSSTTCICNAATMLGPTGGKQPSAASVNLSVALWSTGSVPCKTGAGSHGARQQGVSTLETLASSPLYHRCLSPSPLTMEAVMTIAGTAPDGAVSYPSRSDLHLHPTPARSTLHPLQAAEVTSCHPGHPSTWVPSSQKRRMPVHIERPTDPAW